jgi:hypothetical protein
LEIIGCRRKRHIFLIFHGQIPSWIVSAFDLQFYKSRFGGCGTNTLYINWSEIHLDKEFWG